jgi:hypothetical protein
MARWVIWSGNEATPSIVKLEFELVVVAGCLNPKLPVFFGYSSLRPGNAMGDLFTGQGHVAKFHTVITP